MADTVAPFPLPPELINVTEISATIEPFPLPDEAAFLAATANLTSTTLSTISVSRASRSTFSEAEVTTAFWTTPPRNTTDEIENVLNLLREVDDWNGTLNSTFGNSTSEASGNIFEQRPWLLWLLIGVGVLLIICIALMLLICYFCNKKKKSQQERTPLAAAASPTSQSRLITWLPCCAKCFDRQTRNIADAKRLNDANLNPYNRPPLPPIGASQSIMAGEMDGYQGGHLPAHRLDPIKRHSTFDQFTSSQMLGANIQGLKGVPVINVRAEDMRPLPQLS